MPVPSATRIAVVSVSTLVLAGLGSLGATASYAAPSPAEIATGGSDGWTTAADSTGAVSFVGSADTPLGTGAARLTTGSGDEAGNRSGKAYLLQNGDGGVLLDDLTDLGYSTKVESLASPGSKLAPSMGLSLYSDSGWQGTLVFEPIYQTQEPVVGQWQHWDADAGTWWFTRDVVDADGNVVIPRQSGYASLGDFRDAFAANPAKYANLRLDPRGGGVQVYAGNSSFMPAWNGFSALVDDVTVGTSGGSTTWDLEQGLGSVPVRVDGNSYTVLEDARTFTTIQAPNHATIDGAGHTITAVEDADHRNFQGSVLASAVGDDSAPAELNVRNLAIATEDFSEGSNSGGLLNGIYLNRAGGTLTDVSVNGISHGNGVQEGNGISVRNRVSGDNIDVPRARVTLRNVAVTNFQKTGLLLDGNLGFTVENATVGQGAGPEGQANPVIAANSLQISRGAAGSVSHSTFALNSHEQATGVLLYNARKVDLDHVTVTGAAAAETGISVANYSNTLDTDLTLEHSLVERTNGVGGTGLSVDDAPADAITATVSDTVFRGWTQDTQGDVVFVTAPPVVTPVDVSGTATVTRPRPRTVKVVLRADALTADQSEAKALRWKIVVDGKKATNIRQHAGDRDVWLQRFTKGTGKHVVTIYKNGTLDRTVRVSTR